MEDETVLLIAMEDFSKDPDFPVYCQDSSMFPTFLDQLVHVHYQKIIPPNLQETLQRISL